MDFFLIPFPRENKLIIRRVKSALGTNVKHMSPRAFIFNNNNLYYLVELFNPIQTEILIQDLSENCPDLIVKDVISFSKAAELKKNPSTDKKIYVTGFTNNLKSMLSYIFVGGFSITNQTYYAEVDCALASDATNIKIIADLAGDASLFASYNLEDIPEPNLNYFIIKLKEPIGKLVTSGRMNTGNMNRCVSSNCLHLEASAELNTVDKLYNKFKNWTDTPKSDYKKISNVPIERSIDIFVSRPEIVENLNLYDHFYPSSQLDKSGLFLRIQCNSFTESSRICCFLSNTSVFGIPVFASSKIFNIPLVQIIGYPCINFEDEENLDMLIENFSKCLNKKHGQITGKYCSEKFLILLLDSTKSVQTLIKKKNQSQFGKSTLGVQAYTDKSRKVSKYAIMYKTNSKKVKDDSDDDDDDDDDGEDSTITPSDLFDLASEYGPIYSINKPPKSFSYHITFQNKEDAAKFLEKHKDNCQYSSLRITAFNWDYDTTKENVAEYFKVDKENIYLNEMTICRFGPTFFISFKNLGEVREALNYIKNHPYKNLNIFGYRRLNNSQDKDTIIDMLAERLKNGVSIVYPSPAEGKLKAPLILKRILQKCKKIGKINFVDKYASHEKKIFSVEVYYDILDNQGSAMEKLPDSLRELGSDFTVTEIKKKSPQQIKEFVSKRFKKPIFKNDRKRYKRGK